MREKLIELIGEHQCIRNPFDGECDNNCNACLADHLIANGVTVTDNNGKWIPVTERLPKPFTPVLVYRKSFGTLPPYIKVDKMVLWNDDTQVWTDEMETWKSVTTHWMPLPEPPKGE